MIDLRNTKTLDDILNIIKDEKQRTIKNESYVPQTELVLLSSEELKLLPCNNNSTNASNSMLGELSVHDLERHEKLFKDLLEMETSFYNVMVLILAGLSRYGSKYLLVNADTKKILKLLNNELSDKCKYSLRDGKVQFKLKDDEDYENSNESGFLMMLGIFACYRINLDFLEERNPDLTGLNVLFSLLYPREMEIYYKLSRRFAFNKTLCAEFNTESPEELEKSFKNNKIETWNQHTNVKSGFLKLDNLN